MILFHSEKFSFQTPKGVAELMEDAMWWVETVVVVFLALGGGMCALAVDLHHEDKPCGGAIVLAVTFLVAAVILIFTDGGERSQEWGCPVFNSSNYGLDYNTPYATLANKKVGDRVYALVRLVDQENKQPVRCVYTNAELPPIFSVGSNNSIITLSAAPAK